jgi:para-nitrobenzyl esterase
VDSQEAYEEVVETSLGFLGQEVVDTVLALYPADAYESPRAALVDLLSDSVFTCPARRVARLVAAHQSQPVFRYFFTRRPQTPQGPKPAGHALELVYVFGTLNDIPLYVPPAAEKGLSAAMMGYWSQLAAAGDPNGEGAVQWPAYDPGTDPYLVLDAPVSSDVGVHTDACDFWDDLLGKD